MGIFSDKMEKIYPHIPEPNDFQENPFRSSPDLYPKNRKPTDVCFLTVFTTFLAILCCFIGYCMYHGDILRIINGYDNCGTICGKTRKINENDALLKDCYKITEKSFGRYHLIVKQANSKEYDRICTDTCSNYPGYKQFFNRCLPDKKTALSISRIKYFFVEVSEDFGLYWKELLHLGIISLGLSLAILVLFRYLVGYVVWVVLAGVASACIGASISLWILWINEKHIQEIHSDTDLLFYLALAIVTTIVSILVLLVIFFMRKKIELVIQLFEEAGKAAAAMPALLLEPILTFLAIAGTVALWIYFCLWIGSAGYLTERRTNVFYYHKDGWMKTAGVLNFLGMLWMIQFVIGCQHMIIAGAVSKWYFTRDKSHLSFPITESFYNLTRYHLGSIAVGSFFITLIQILRIIVATLRSLLEKEHNSCLMCVTKACLCLCNCCLKCLEKIVQILTRNAYIIIAMYGHSFFKAGRKAFANLVAHPISLAAINSVGDFVLFLAKVLVVVVTVVTGSYLLKDKQGIQFLWVPLLLAGLFGYFISHCFMTVYEMTIDTVFICFCEDCELNDGVSKPYYMSRGLMEFVDNSKKALEIHDKIKMYGNRQSKLTEIPSLSNSVELETKHNSI